MRPRSRRVVLADGQDAQLLLVRVIIDIEARNEVARVAGLVAAVAIVMAAFVLPALICYIWLGLERILVAWIRLLVLSCVRNV